MKLQVRNYKREMEIVFYREKGGWIFPKIAEKYGISTARARQLYMRVVEERLNINKEMGIGA